MTSSGGEIGGASSNQNSRTVHNKKSSALNVLAGCKHGRNAKIDLQSLSEHDAVWH